MHDCMDDTRRKCVLLSSLATRVDEDDIRKCLDFCDSCYFKDKYEAVHKYIRGEGEHWLVLFKSEEAAIECVEKDQLEVDTKSGSCVIKPTRVCQTVQLPETWTQEYQVNKSDITATVNDTESLNLLNFSASCYSVQSVDLFDSFEVVDKIDESLCVENLDIEEKRKKSRDMFGSGNIEQSQEQTTSDEPPIAEKQLTSDEPPLPEKQPTSEEQPPLNAELDHPVGNKLKEPKSNIKEEENDGCIDKSQSDKTAENDDDEIDIRSELPSVQYSGPQYIFPMYHARPQDASSNPNYDYTSQPLFPPIQPALLGGSVRMIMVPMQIDKHGIMTPMYNVMQPMPLQMPFQHHQQYNSALKDANKDAVDPTVAVAEGGDNNEDHGGQERKDPLYLSMKGQFERTLSTESTDRFGYVKKAGAERVRPSLNHRSVSTDHYGYKTITGDTLSFPEEIIYDEIDCDKLVSSTRLPQRKAPDLPPREPLLKNLPRYKKAMSEFGKDQSDHNPNSKHIQTHAAFGSKIDDIPEEGANGEYELAVNKPVRIVDSDDQCCKIKVRGIPPAVSKESLQLFFTTTKESGGGDVLDITMMSDKGEAIVEFRLSSAVQNVLKKHKTVGGLIFYDTKLSISAYIPPPIDNLKTFVSGLSEDTTEETLKEFVTTRTNIAVEVEFGATPGTALLAFDRPPDLSKLKQECKNQKLNGSLIELSDVEVTRSVKVQGYKYGSSKDALTYYFENTRKSNGGVVESTVFRNHGDICIVTFEKPEDAEKVCQTNHKLDDNDLNVRLHYPCLDLDLNFLATIPDPIHIDQLNPYIVRFLMYSEVYKKFVEEEIGKCYGVVEWPSTKNNPSFKITCTVDPMERRGKEKVLGWREKCLKVINKIRIGLSVNDHINIAQEVWSKTLDRISNINVSHPQYIAIFNSREECCIIVTGERRLVSEISKQIDRIVSELEKELSDPLKNVTKRKMLKRHQLDLLRTSRFEEGLKRGTLKVNLNEEENGIAFQGNINEVNHAIKALNKKLEDFVKKSITGYSEAVIGLLNQENTINYIKEKLNKNKVFGVWEIIADTNICVYSNSNKELELAIDIIQKCIGSRDFPLDREEESLINSDSGRAHIEDMRRKYDGYFVITQGKGVLMLACADYLLVDISGEIHKFFNIHQVVSEFLDIEAGMLRFIREFKKRDVEEVKEQYRRQAVKVGEVLTDTKCGFEINGKKDGCKMAINQLQKLVTAVIFKAHCVSSPLIEDFVQTNDGEEELQNIELNEKCVLQLKHALLIPGGNSQEKDTPSASDSSDSGSGGSFNEASGRTNEASKVQGDVDLEVIVGELAHQEADVIVNSTNQMLDLRVGSVSKALVQTGGSQIQEECNSRYPNGIKYGEVASTFGGRLKCTSVYHGMLANWDSGQGHAEKVMAAFMHKCLMKADEDNYSSIAFPALGTGAVGFPADVTARVMFECVESIQQNFKSLRKVVLVVWKGDSDTIKAFQERKTALRLRNEKTKHLPRTVAQSRTSVYLDRVDAAGSGQLVPWTIGQVTVFVVQGDITEEKTSMIVNSTIKGLTLNTGMVSKAILKAAGQTIQTACKSAAVHKKMNEDGFVVTDAGTLLCQKIIHVKAKTKTDNWGPVVKKCLQVAEEKGSTSISFPALGTGGKGLEPSSVAKAMFEAFKDYVMSPEYQRCLKMIRIVIFESAMVTPFANAADEVLQKKKKERVHSILPRFMTRKSTKSKQSKVSGVDFYIYAGTECCIDKVTKALDTMYTKENVAIDKTLLAKLDEREIKKFHNIASEFGVDSIIPDSKDVVELKGYRKAVGKASAAIDDYICQYENDMLIAETMAIVTLPKTFSPMSMNDPVKLYQLLPNDHEHKKVYDKFSKETGLPHNAIGKIERIQNPTLFSLYKGKTKQLKKNNKGKNEIRQLWHSSSRHALANINESGFSKRQGSEGVYFAVEASAVVRGVTRQNSCESCSPDVDGNRYIYLADVALGIQTINAASHSKGSEAARESYDSKTDNISNPTFFMVRKSSQAYPMYLVTFKM